MTLQVKWSRYRPGVAQRVGRGIALLFHDRCTRRGWVVSSTPRPHFTPGKDPVTILREARWAPGPVWTGRKSRPHRDSIPDLPARSQSPYRLSYPAHTYLYVYRYNIIYGFRAVRSHTYCTQIQVGTVTSVRTKISHGLAYASILSNDQLKHRPEALPMQGMHRSSLVNWLYTTSTRSRANHLTLYV